MAKLTKTEPPVIPTVCDLRVLSKLASIAVHADELTGPCGHQFDHAALRPLLESPDVVNWIAAMTRAGLAPVKRLTPAAEKAVKDIRRRTTR